MSTLQAWDLRAMLARDQHDGAVAAVADSARLTTLLDRPPVPTALLRMKPRSSGSDRGRAAGSND